jgi:DNA-binding NtrC family response regulator
LLVQHFRRQLAQTGAALVPLGSETMTPLLAHQWPGNVRELEHWVARIALAERGPATELTSPQGVVAPGAEFAAFDAERLTLAALERRYILHVLTQERGHQSRAADRLGIDRRTLYRKLKEYRDNGVTVRVAG